MKYLLFGIFAALLLFGCLTREDAGRIGKAELEAQLNQSNGALGAQDAGLISARGDKAISVVTIRAVNSSGKWRFPLSDYPDEFAWAGMYSDSFVRLNSSHIEWLDDGETIWLTIYRGNGSGVLFNAIYSNSLADCGSGKARILGKEYTLSSLKNGSSFLLDDKWKVAVDGGSACPERIAIYLDGYFDGLEEGDQISLFRNDNTVLLEFTGMDSEPRAKVVAARPA